MLLSLRREQGDITSGYLLAQKETGFIFLIVLWGTPGQFLREIAETSFDHRGYIII